MSQLQVTTTQGWTPIRCYLTRSMPLCQKRGSTP
jgi:hypothetical protein